MTAVVRYTCRADLLPLLEGALAAQGYHIQIPFQKSLGGATAMVMACGGTFILLTHTPPSELGELEVWGEAPLAAMRLLESLPLAIQGAHFVTSQLGSQVLRRVRAGAPLGAT
jgi:hypothetical protein